MLERFFVKDYENTEDPRVRNAYGVLASVIGMIVNVCLSTAKIVVGALFSSVAIIADGLNNMSDAGSSIVTMLGFRVANRPADKKHPFGHARVEYVTSMIISFIVLFLGIELMIGGVEKIITGSDTDVNIIMMIVLAVSIFVKILMCLYMRHMARKIDAEPLKATSVDSLSDAVSSSVVLISMIVTYYTDYDLDGIMAIVVALFIVVGGIRLFRETISPLLGEAPSEEFVQHISEKVHTYDGVLGTHDLIVHNYGYRRYYASLHIEVDASCSILEGHELADTIERDFRDEGIEMLVHVDPITTSDERVDAMREIVENALHELDKRISIHDFRVVWGSAKKKLVFDIVLPDDFTLSDDDVIAWTENHVREHEPTACIVADIDRHYIEI